MLNTKLIKDAQKIVDQNRKTAEATADKNMQKALLDNEFKENFWAIKQAEFENARCEAYGEPPKFNTTQLYKQQQNILQKLNILSTALTPNYFCKTCNDTGYTNGQMCCCLKSVINNILYEKSGFNKTLNTFENTNCDIFDNKDKAQILYNSMQKWCNKDNPYNIIVLCGKAGVGKTHLMECMASSLIANNKIVYFVSSFNMNQSLLKYHTTFDETKAYSLEDLLEPEYLFIDDLGTEPIFKNVTVEGLYNIISDRLYHNKKTIISTNLGLADIERVYGERIFSRLVNQKVSLCFNIQNSDLRLKK